MKLRKQLKVPKIEIDLSRIQQLSQEHDNENELHLLSSSPALGHLHSLSRVSASITLARKRAIMQSDVRLN